jgi:hypothetical protein
MVDIYLHYIVLNIYISIPISISEWNSHSIENILYYIAPIVISLVFI